MDKSEQDKKHGNDRASGVGLYPVIYINIDGSARELHENEQKLLETHFHPNDGARPFIKKTYTQKNGWGEIAGFLKRANLPPGTAVQPAGLHDVSKPLSRSEQIEFLRSKGIEVTENSDGTFTARKPKR